MLRNYRQFIKKQKLSTKERMALEMRKEPKLKTCTHKSSLIGARYKNPNFKKGDLVEFSDSELSTSTLFEGDVGVVLSKTRQKGMVRFSYLVYWQKANMKKNISEPDLRQARSKNDSRECND